MAEKTEQSSHPGSFPRKDKKRELLFTLIALASGCLVAVIIAEVMLRILGLGYGRSGHISDPYLHHVNPPSFEFIAHSPAGEFAPFTVKYNELGFRQRNMETAKKVRMKLALMGDSYTLSRELPYDSTFAGLCEAQCADSCAVINFGVASYSPLLYAIQWQRIVKDYAPTHVLVQLYVNDAEDDITVARLAKYGPDGSVESVPGPSAGEMALKKWIMKSYLMRFIFKVRLQLQWLLLHSDEFGNAVGGFIEPNPEIPPISKQMILQLSKNVAATGAQLAITVIPSKCRLQGTGCDTTRAEFSERWRRWAEKNGIRFLDLVEPFRDAAKKEKLFFDRDIHLNGYGSSILAAQIIKTWPELFLSTGARHVPSLDQPMAVDKENETPATLP